MDTDLLRETLKRVRGVIDRAEFETVTRPNLPPLSRDERELIEWLGDDLERLATTLEAPR